jgi:acetyl esterase/lipase
MQNVGIREVGGKVIMKNADINRTYKAIHLWDDSIPGYDSTLSEEIPSMIPYLLDSSEPSSAVIVCPGGAYCTRAPHEAEPIALWLNSIGLSAFVLNYRVVPYRYPFPLVDAQRAVRYVRYMAKEWNVSPNRLGILGFSAGGHLVSTVGTHFDHGKEESDDPIERMSSRPDAMVLCYPVITFVEFRHHGSMINLLGPEPTDDLRNLLSSEKHVTEQTPPTFLWHTADDEAVPVENSLLFAQALSRHKVPFESHIFPKGRHGLGLAKDDPQVSAWTELCAKWFQGMGWI